MFSIAVLRIRKSRHPPRQHVSNTTVVNLATTMYTIGLQMVDHGDLVGDAGLRSITC